MADLFGQPDAPKYPPSEGAKSLVHDITSPWDNTPPTVDAPPREDRARLAGWTPEPAPERLKPGEVCYIRVNVIGGVKNFDDAPAVQVQPIRPDRQPFTPETILTVREAVLIKASDAAAALRGGDR
jgi:hypothetical protein